MPTYWVKSGTGGTDAGTSWANAAESIAGLMAAQAIAGGDIIYVHNTHSVAAGAAITWTLPESAGGLVQVLCVDGGDATGASLVDGTVGNLTTGAIEATNGNYAFTINCTSGVSSALFVHGMTIKSGGGTSESSADIIIGTASSNIKFNKCDFWLNSTSSSALMTIGSNSTNDIAFNDCTLRFGATGQYIQITTSIVEFTNCAISASGSSPTTLFSATVSQKVQEILCHSCDWSAATNVINVANFWVGGLKCHNCAIGTPTTGTHSGYSNGVYEFHACDSSAGASDILNYYKLDYFGTVEDSQSVYRATGGAQGEQASGTDTSYSLVMNPSAAASKTHPLFTPWIHKLITSTGDKTVSIKIAHTESAVLTGGDVFMEVEYMGEPGLAGTQRVANSAMSIVEIDDGAPLLTGTLSRDVIAAGSNRTDDAADDWTGLSSEKEHTLTASINIADVGYIRCRVGLTKDTTNEVYVDPLITVA